ncbi:V-type ATP synthase subunit I [Methanoculleus sp. FWC-SCC1]|uniref:A-type ATP synthase subunit I n=1 Tax=Methanoculleus frigidifontis TaxID=2584085 RepID=A0ABT8M780_9EURY|nr:V-type ATP synthase subunit I [Methanoculleus sp. FWC-SCC1]MDN7023776.1 V-type ATP synthase subunit I [Methanoculleus sp. FWC-SCC1]
MTVLSPAEMLVVTIGVHAAEAEAAARALHESGLVEIRDIHDGPGENAPALTPGERAWYTTASIDYRLKIDRILAAISESVPERKPSLRDLFVPRSTEPTLVPALPFPEITADLDRLIGEGGQAIALQQELAGLRERTAELEADLQAAGRLRTLGVHPEHLGTAAYVTVLAGTVPADAAESVRDAIAALATDEVLLLSHETDETAVFAIATVNGRLPAVEEALAGTAWEPIAAPGLAGTPEEVIRRLEAERAEVRERSQQTVGEIAAIRDALGDLLQAYREEAEMLREEGEVFSLTGSTQEIVVIEGFVRASDRARLEALVEEASGGTSFCRFSPPDPARTPVPVAYQNPAWAQPFEMLTSLFAVPRYGGIDPTVIIAPIIVLYFGFMLGDAGYGLVLVLGAYLGYHLLSRSSRSVRDLTLILLACGVSGIVFGLLQGGFFGDLLPRFFGMELPFTVIDPLAEPVTILVVALAIGVVQINAGLLLGLRQNVAANRTRQGIFEQCSWFILQPAAAVLALGFFGWATLPPAAEIIAVIGAVTGIGMVFVAYGPLGAFRLTNFLGDWLSYTRILALDLATLGIALTINILTGMIAAISPWLVPVAVAFAVVAHTLNLLLQALGGMIHSLRLQYVEFFGKFYTGGGRAFAPFAAVRRHSLRSGGEKRW